MAIYSLLQTRSGKKLTTQNAPEAPVLDGSATTILALPQSLGHSLEASKSRQPPKRLFKETQIRRKGTAIFECTLLERRCSAGTTRSRLLKVKQAYTPKVSSIRSPLTLGRPCFAFDVT